MKNIILPIILGIFLLSFFSGASALPSSSSNFTFDNLANQGQDTGTTKYIGNLTLNPNYIPISSNCIVGNCISTNWQNGTVKTGGLTRTSGTMTYWFKLANDSSSFKDRCTAIQQTVGLRDGDFTFLIGNGTSGCNGLGDHNEGIRTFFKSSASSFALDYNYAFIKNTWYQMAITVDNSGTYLYLDGNLVNSSTNSYTSGYGFFNTDGDTYFFGASGVSGADQASSLNATFDEFKLFTTSLSSAEVLDLYNNEKPNALLINSTKISPINNTPLNSSSIVFTVFSNVTKSNSLLNPSLRNVTFTILNSTNGIYKQEVVNISGLSNTTSHKFNNLNYGDNYIWNAYVCANDSTQTTCTYSDNNNFTIPDINFGLCNATLTVPYINFTFKDESTLNSMNATFQTANFDYYVGDGTIKKSYLYSTSSNFPSYAFCALPSSSNLNIVPMITYLFTNYPARFYQPGILPLTNQTTNKTLYLLSSTDGIYVTFVTQSLANTVISSADIVITRLIGGVTTTVSQGITDDSGSFVAWLNPLYSHTVTASKLGYGTNTQVITPTQSAYTLTLGSSANYTYVSNVRGLLWAYFPRDKITANATNFGFNVSSVYGNIVKCQIQLLDNNKTTILSSAETIATNSSYCSVQTTYTPNSNYPKIKGRLLVDIGDGYQILEEDAYWILIPYDTTGMTFTDFFNSLSKFDLSYFGGDVQHQEFTYILAFFLVLMILCAVINQAGWDIQTNGGLIIFCCVIIWLASVPGFLELSGISPYTIIDKYFVAVVYTLFTVGFATRNF